jgi:hypothetical protein
MIYKIMTYTYWNNSLERFFRSHQTFPFSLKITFMYRHYKNTPSRKQINLFCIIVIDTPKLF